MRHSWMPNDSLQQVAVVLNHLLTQILFVSPWKFHEMPENTECIFYNPFNVIFGLHCGTEGTTKYSTQKLFCDHEWMLIILNKANIEFCLLLNHCINTSLALNRSPNTTTL